MVQARYARSIKFLSIPFASLSLSTISHDEDVKVRQLLWLLSLVLLDLSIQWFSEHGHFHVTLLPHFARCGLLLEKRNISCFAVLFLLGFIAEEVIFARFTPSSCQSTCFLRQSNSDNFIQNGGTRNHPLESFFYIFIYFVGLPRISGIVKDKLEK